VYRVDAAPEYVGRFTVRGAEDTDGIELAVGNLGPQFPQGLFACHSGQSPCPILLTPAERVFDALRIARRIERRP
jgi:myo-inositol-hexaphosphate 3-phosphohydrolase